MKPFVISHTIFFFFFCKILINLYYDKILRYQAEPEVKMITLLGEVGGVEEYEVCAALKDKRITKPLVAWCIGTCASKFTSN